MCENYWKQYWNKSAIIFSSDYQIQVGRTINKIPVSNEIWKFTLKHIENQLKIESEDQLLDLCCGNGLISAPLSLKCKSVTAVDVSKPLLKIFPRNYKNIKIINADIRRLNFKPSCFSKVLIYFAIQHFSERETFLLIQHVYKWLKPNGICLIGDIPDQSKIWDFFDTKERSAAYFKSIKNGKPIIGNWFNKSFFLHAAEILGYHQVKVFEQPKKLINSHYRFDVILNK